MTGQTARRLSFLCWFSLASLLGPGCSAPPPELTTARLRLRFSTESACRVPTPTLDIRALGDFTGGGEFTERLVPVAGTSVVIDRFPLDTRAISVFSTGDTGWTIGAVHRLASSDEALPLLLLPRGRPCVHPDGGLALPKGGALAVTQGNGLLIVGGATDDTPSRTTTWLATPGAEPVVWEGLSIQRVGASATATGNRVLVVGGGLEVEGAGLDTYEVFDVIAGRFRQVLERLCTEGDCRRREHGAGVLADGRVLIAGGVASSAPSAGEAEVLVSTAIIDPDSGDVIKTADLPNARLSPQVLTLDNELVLVVGGRGAMGPGPAVGTVFWYDEVADAFLPVSGEEIPLPSRTEGVAVSLPGARLAWLDGSPVVHLLLFGDGPFFPERVDLDLTGDLPVLSGIRAVGTPEGGLLVSGVDEGGAARVLRVDVSRPTVEDLDTAAPPAALAALLDGTVVELREDGAHFRRTTIRNEFDSPPATMLPEDEEWMAFDAASHWVQEGSSVRSNTEGATIHISALTLTDFSAVLNAEGNIVLWLRSGAVKIPVEFSRTETRQGLCVQSHAEGAAVSLVRRGAALEITADGETKHCTLEGLGTRVALSISAPENTLFSSLSIERL